MKNIPVKLVDVRVGNGFIGKRNARERINSWKYIQNYMLEQRMTNRANALFAMIAIRVFVYMPSVLKRSLYRMLLRS